MTHGGALLDGLAGDGQTDARAGRGGDDDGLAGEEAVAADVLRRLCGHQEGSGRDA